jgi:histidine triad (HIT) family protein
MENCIFCKLAGGEIPTKVVYEDDRVFAFEDMAPQAPVHILIIPKKHVENALALSEEDDALIAHLLRTAGKIAREKGLDKTGFRLVSNCGEDARQSVKHVHIHLLGGHAMSDSMA